MISPLPLLFFGGNIRVYEEDGRDTIEVDDGIKFHSPTRCAQLVKVRAVFYQGWLVPISDVFISC